MATRPGDKDEGVQYGRRKGKRKMGKGEGREGTGRRVLTE